MKKLRTLTDEQFETLRGLASSFGCRLTGFTCTGGGILLYNSKCDGVFGRTMNELKNLIIHKMS